MLGLDEGWVCGDDLDLSRTGALKMLGNGIVPQQAALALALLDPIANHDQDDTSDAGSCVRVAGRLLATRTRGSA
jgi:hypothetical protein